MQLHFYTLASRDFYPDRKFQYAASNSVYFNCHNYAEGGSQIQRYMKKIHYTTQPADASTQIALPMTAKYARFFLAKVGE